VRLCVITTSTENYPGVSLS